MRRAAGIILLVCALAGLSHETRALDLSTMTDAQLGRAFRESMHNEGFFGGLKSKLGSLFSGAKKVANTLGITPQIVVDKVNNVKDVLCGEKVTNMVATTASKAQSGSSVLGNFIKNHLSSIKDVATSGCKRAFSSVSSLVVQENPRLKNMMEHAVICGQVSGEDMCKDAIGCDWYNTTWASDEEIPTAENPEKGCYRVPCDMRADSSEFDNHGKPERMKEFCERPVYQNLVQDEKENRNVTGAMSRKDAATLYEGRPLICIVNSDDNQTCAFQLP